MSATAAPRPIAATDPAGTPRRAWVPWFVLGMGLSLTGLAGWAVSATTANRDAARFHDLAGAAADQLTDAVDGYVSVLHGMAGLFAAAGPTAVTPAQFHDYVVNLGVAERFPGIRGVGYAVRVSRDRLAAFVADQRQRVGPGFAVNPPPAAEATEFMPVVLIESADHGPSGYDLLSNPGRRAAIDRAIDGGRAVATGKLRLVSQPAGEPPGGFVIYLPVYPGAAGGPTTRRAVTAGTAPAGMAFASFACGDLFARVFDSQVRNQVRVVVTDDGPVGEPAAATVLYDPTAATTAPTATAAAQADPPPRMLERRWVTVAGRRWQLDVTDRPGFESVGGGHLAGPILLCGLAITGVLFALSRGQANAAAEAADAAGRLLVAGRTLAGTQARVRRLVDSNLIGVFFCRADGTVLDGNGAFFRLLGRDVPTADGPPLRLADVTDPAGHPAQAAALNRVAGPIGGTDGRASGIRSATAPPFEAVLLRPDGTRVPVLVGLAGSTDVTGRPEVVAFTLDLTDRHRAERELRQAKEAAEHASHAKDQFLAILSHELRTPLTPVLAAATAGEADDRLPADVREELAMIHRNVELEARLIDDLLDLTRVGRGKLQLQEETVDVHAAVAGAVEVCAAPDPLAVANGSAAAPPPIAVDLRATAHHVRGDPARLRQVVWNLIKNAVKFTPADGRVLVRTWDDGEAGRRAVHIAVVDTGVGMEADVLPKVFDAFEQGSAARARASGGLGLGLAITRGLVEAHGGTITAASDGPGRGSTFTVTLPTVPAPAAVAAAVPAAPATAARTGRILLVEDHADTAKIMAKLLGRAGHDVTVAHTVAEAGRCAHERSFDLLVSDFGLPDGTGADVIAAFRRTPGHATTPALALTGYGADHDLSRSAAAGFAEHLTKPVAFDALQRAIARVMAGGGHGGVNGDRATTPGVFTGG